MSDNINIKSSVINIAIFASGAGTNAERIMTDFGGDRGICVKLVVSNKKSAGVLEVAKRANVAQMVVNRELFGSDDFVEKLKDAQVHFIVLAGFLWKIPETLINEFPDRIVNIHPALLPEYGGHGMYGKFVHEAVIESKASLSGITIHLVDEKYDNGKILFQASCPLDLADTPDTLATKIHQLEHAHFSKVIASQINFLRNNN